MKEKETKKNSSSEKSNRYFGLVGKLGIAFVLESW